MEIKPSRPQGFTPLLTELYPNGSSKEGFLSSDQSLNEVVKRDNQALTLLGYTTKEIAELLKPIIGIADGYGKYVAPNGKEYAVTTVGHMGFQNCPWRDVLMAPNSSIDVYVEGEMGRIRIPGMLPHLITAHNFFEGGAYRLAPEKIVELFGVEKNHGSITKARKLTF